MSKPTTKQIERAFVHFAGYLPRASDTAVIDVMGGSFEETAWFLWDHHLGEPDSPTQEEIETFLKRGTSCLETEGGGCGDQDCPICGTG